MYKEIKEQLLSLSEKKLSEFNYKLCPDTNYKILGVKIPELRKIAKKIAKENAIEFLEKVKGIKQEYLEEILLEGFVIGYYKTNIKEKLKLISDFVPKMDSWITTDTVCSTIKVKDKELQEVWQFILLYVKSEREFDVRFGIIMMLDNYINLEYVDEVIQILDGIEHKGYYVQMAIAWIISVIGVKFNDKAMKYLKGENHLDKFTYNKTLQKMIESYRISNEQKKELKNMKRK